MKPKILYEDKHLIVCEKPHGIPTQTSRTYEPDMVSILKNHLYSELPPGPEPYLAVIHRLDQPVRGILVFAKTPAAAARLNKQLRQGSFSKHYLALLANAPELPEATLTDYLVKENRSNRSRICAPDTPGAKKAVLSYKQLKDKPSDSIIVKIVLETGRHHQIRVQMSHQGCPIIGDTKYNPKPFPDGIPRELALCAYKLEFEHPVTQKHLSYIIPFNS